MCHSLVKLFISVKSLRAMLLTVIFSVLKYNFDIPVLPMSISIFPTLHFYPTTFQRKILSFLLHYIHAAVILSQITLQIEIITFKTLLIVIDQTVAEVLKT